MLIITNTLAITVMLKIKAIITAWAGCDNSHTPPPNMSSSSAALAGVVMMASWIDVGRVDVWWALLSACFCLPVVLVSRMPNRLLAVVGGIVADPGIASLLCYN